MSGTPQAGSIREGADAPCNVACPAGEDVRAWMAEVKAGRYRAAWELIVRDNPLPAVVARVCYQPCEDRCHRADFDEAVGVHHVERFLGDLALEHDWQVPCEAEETGKRVMIVGAGPTGLSAAWHLARRGHAVTILEAEEMAGGMMHFGIPAYRLPRVVLDTEIGRISRAGVEIRLGHRVTDLAAERAAGNFDAVLLAAGAHLSRRQEIPARDASKVFDAVQFLRAIELGGARPRLGRRVAVYGGGNTAVDAARTARRLGAQPLIIYRRSRRDMAIQDFELEEAVEEGVRVQWLRAVRGLDGSRLRVEVMRLDEGRRPVPTGEFETLEADSLIMALGQEADTSFLESVPAIRTSADGSLMVGEDMQTGCPGVFAGGDMVPSDRTVPTAIGHGRRAARQIDAHLRGVDVPPLDPPGPQLEPRAGRRLRPIRRDPPSITLQQRTRTFDEIAAGLTLEGATGEAQRCFSCRTCPTGC